MPATTRAKHGTASATVKISDVEIFVGNTSRYQIGHNGSLRIYSGESVVWIDAAAIEDLGEVVKEARNARLAYEAGPAPASKAVA